MGKKVKSEECSGRWCGRHLFSIKPFFKVNDYAKQDTIRLCPKFNKTTKKLENLLPVINQDLKFYTPLFLLQEDRPLYVDYDVKNRECFLESQRQEQQEISDIMIPKQSSSKKYCKVCKDDFVDYLQHIQSQTHRLKSKKNPFTSYIQQLQLRFQQPPIKPQIKNAEEQRPILEDFMRGQDSTLPIDTRNKVLLLTKENLMSQPLLNQASVEQYKQL